MRYVFKLAIRSGTEHEYERRHREVYPKLLQVFRDAGVKTYSIFRDGVTLFGYMERDAPKERRCASSVPQKLMHNGQAYMSNILVAFRSGNTMETLPEVFHFES